MINHVMVTWVPSDAILQQADTPFGPWDDLPGATSPLMVLPTNRARFYRAYLP
jgi:hypothetical protein